MPIFLTKGCTWGWVLASSTAMPTKATLPANFLLILTMLGISWRQGGHQVAKKLIMRALPLLALSRLASPALSSGCRGPWAEALPGRARRSASMAAKRIFFILFVPAGRAPSGLAGPGDVPLLRWLDGAKVYSTRPPFTRMFPHPRPFRRAPGLVQARFLDIDKAPWST